MRGSAERSYFRRMTRNAAAAAGLVALMACVGQALSEEGAPARALASVSEGPPEHIGAYPKHENHPTKKWVAMLRSEPMSYGLQHWACYHESHAPEAIALEGQIGMTSPGGGNWYHNGFFNFAVGEAEGRNFAIRRVRALDSGERASCEFVWELPQAWVRVVFLVVPGQFPLFCSIREYPKGNEAAALKVRLACYPGGYFRDGSRVALTARQEIKVGKVADLDPRAEPWLILYDERYDKDVEGSVGGCGGLALPEPVAKSTVETGSYGCWWRIEAKEGEKELRFAFWSGLGMKNEELIPHLKSQFAAAEKELETLDFRPLRFGGSFLANLKTEFDRLLRETKDANTEAEAFKSIEERIGELWPRVQGEEVDLGAEDDYLMALNDLEKLLWQLRMKWVFSD
jgi:hypothetical protein